MRVLAIFAAALALAACASQGESGIYSRELATLRQQCEARNGILTPVRPATGTPPTDYACEIHGSASRLD
jgi:hypothetical protein